MKEISLLIFLFLSISTASYSQCSGDMEPINFDSFEYTGTVPGIIPGTTYGASTSTANPFTGARHVYMNFVNGFTGVACRNDFTDLCTSVPHQVQWTLGNTWGAAIDCNVNVHIYNAGVLIETINCIVGPYTTYTSSSFIPDGPIRFEIETIKPGGGGNDLAFDDLTLLRCHKEAIDYSETICPETELDLTTTIAADFTGAGIWETTPEMTGSLFFTSDPDTYSITYNEETHPLCPDEMAHIEITVPPLPLVTANADKIEVCEGEEIVLTGAGALTYNWDMGAINGISFPPPIGTTTYSVTGEDPNGCFSTDAIDITVNPLPNITANADKSEVCLGEKITLTGEGATTYNWDMGVTDGLEFTPPLGSSTYTLIGTNDNGCINTATITINVNPLPNVTAETDNSKICKGEPIVLTGNGAISYDWDKGVIDDVAFTPPLGITTYTLIGEDNNGCKDTTTIDITVNQHPNVSILANKNEICQGDFIRLKGYGATTYHWNLGVINGIEFVPPSGTTTYNLIGIDNNGCTDTATIDITAKNCNDNLIWTPNAFTPNGSQLNNSFQVYYHSSIQFSQFRLLILNRWGEIVWESFDPNAKWQGDYLGGNGLVQDNVYVWSIEYQLNGEAETKTKQGHVTVLR